MKGSTFWRWPDGLRLEGWRWEKGLWLPTLPETNIAPENGGPPGKGDSGFGNHHFQVRAVSFREGILYSTFCDLPFFGQGRKEDKEGSGPFGHWSSNHLGKMAKYIKAHCLLIFFS